MADRSPFSFTRIVNAAKYRLGQRLESWIAPTERHERRGGDGPRDRPFQAKAESELIGDPLALIPGSPAPDGKPPDEEYKDLPITVWIDWAIKSARGALVDHQFGYFGRSSMLVEAMLGDDRIQSAFDGRVKGVTKCEPLLVPSRAQGGQAVCDELTDLWEEILPEETLEEIMRWAVFCGFALVEVIWEPWSNQNRWIPRLKVWHPYYVYYRIDIRKYIAITADGLIEIDPNDPKWLLFTPHGLYRGWILGRVRSCAIPWLVRQFALRDLARFSEVHGLPMRVAKYPAQAPAEDKARFVAGIKNLGAETTVGLPVQAGAEAAAYAVELVEAKDTSWKAFIELRNACDISITLAIRGTNLTSVVGEGNSGNRAAAEVHRDEDDDYSRTDRRKLMGRLLRRQLFPWYCIFNHGRTDLVPARESAFVHPDDEDTLKKLQTQEQAAKTVVALRAAGAPVDARQTYAQANVVLIEGREEEANDPKKALPPPKNISEPYDGKGPSEPKESSHVVKEDDPPKESTGDLTESERR